MGLIESAIGLISPRAAAQRAAWNRKRELLESSSIGKRGYAGAGRGKRVRDWNPQTKSADAELALDGKLLRARSFDLIRNNPHAANIVTRHADNIVGTGFTPKFKTGDKKNDALVKELWNDFSANIDPEGLQNFDGKTYQAVRGMVGGGEIYARKRARRPKDYRVPLQIQTLEADFVDTAKRSPYSVKSQNTVVQGVEFDAIGGRAGYWMFRQDPSSERRFVGIDTGSVFVPSSEVLHLYEPLRNQVHGEPWLAPVMIRLRNLDEYDEAEIIRKKTEACMVGVVIPQEDEEDDDENPNSVGLPLRQEAYDPETGELMPTDPSLEWGVEDADGNPVERMEPGMFYYARGGSKVEFNTPATSAGYDTYTRTQLRSIAAGARMPYEVMTGDLSEVSFASGRMGTIQYQRFVEQIQWNIVVPMWCRPIERWFIDTIKAAGLVAEGLSITCEWTAPAFQSITPIDDSNADKADVRAGFASWDEKVRARGQDPDVVAAEIVARNKFWDDNEVVLDIDPRQVSMNGQKHSAPGSGADQGSTNAPGEQEREEAARKQKGGSGRRRRR